MLASHGGHRKSRSLHRDPAEQGGEQDALCPLSLVEPAQLVLHVAHGLRVVRDLHGVHGLRAVHDHHVEHGFHVAHGREEVVILHVRVHDLALGFDHDRGRCVVQQLLLPAHH